MKNFRCIVCSKEELLFGFYQLCDNCSNNMAEINSFLDDEWLTTSSEKIIKFLSL